MNKPINNKLLCAIIRYALTERRFDIPEDMVVHAVKHSLRGQFKG
jgi:hypothetical protein